MEGGIRLLRKDTIRDIVNRGDQFEQFALRNRDPAEIAALEKKVWPSLADELEAAEEQFRARAPEIGEQLPEIAKTAEKSPAHSPLAQAAARIAGVVGRADLSKPGPYWTLIVLYSTRKSLAAPAGRKSP
jgi:hypothetical protein